jgi:hypothetical protein
MVLTGVDLTYLLFIQLSDELRFPVFLFTFLLADSELSL